VTGNGRVLTAITKPVAQGFGRVSNRAAMLRDEKHPIRRKVCKLGCKLGQNWKINPAARLHAVIGNPLDAALA
jgi:hypothetical protein